MEATKHEYKVAATIRAAEDEEVNEVIETLKTAENQEQFNILLAAFETRKAASPSPVVNGLPRMLHITAWIAHEGYNNNLQGFIAAELLEAVSERRVFNQAAFAGFLDFNHDLSPRGYWYKSEYLFDASANKNGILAHGAVWAWLFPDFADKMLATQVRDGEVEVSMAVLTNNVELTTLEDGRFGSLLHDPVFVGASFLDVPPADPDGEGVVSEDPASTTESRKDELLRLAALQEDLMTVDEIHAAMETVLAKLGEDVVGQIKVEFDSKVAEFKGEMAKRDENIATLTAQLATANSAVTELEVKVAEKDMAIEAFTASKTEADVLIASLEAQLADINSAEEVRMASARKDSRLKSLPEPIRLKLAAMDVSKREALENSWTALTDEQWPDKLVELSLGMVEPKHALPNFPVRTDTRIDLSRHLLPN